MSDPAKPRWSFRGLLFTGLAAVLPTLLVVLITVKGFDLVHSFGGAHVLALLAPRGEPSLALRLLADILALALLVTLALGVGFVVRSVFGRLAVDWLESMILRIPLVRGIYPALRQLTDFVVSDKRPAEFQRVVAIPYPHPGVYAIGFVTGEGLDEVAAAAGGRVLTVFVPSSPMPFTGWIALVPAEQAVPVRMTVEEAIRFSVSLGVSRPPAP